MADALSMFGFLFQIRSVEAVHRFFEKFPEAFMDKLHVPVPKRFSMFL
jgi:callose synthase